METQEKALSESQKLALAREAFHRYFARCFWFMRRDLEISPADVPAIAEGLRKNGGAGRFPSGGKTMPLTDLQQRLLRLE